MRKLGPNGQPFSDIIFSPDGEYVYCSGAFKGGAFGLWSPLAQGDLWLTAYVLDFLETAAERGNAAEKHEGP